MTNVDFELRGTQVPRLENEDLELSCDGDGESIEFIEKHAIF